MYTKYDEKVPFDKKWFENWLNSGIFSSYPVNYTEKPI